MQDLHYKYREQFTASTEPFKSAAVNGHAQLLAHAQSFYLNRRDQPLDLNRNSFSSDGKLHNQCGYDLEQDIPRNVEDGDVTVINNEQLVKVLAACLSGK